MSILSPHPDADVQRAVSPGRLLAPERRIVPFVGRTAELRSLLEWCVGRTPVAVRLVSGPSGVGKTRLARAVAQHMAREGWTCLDVPDGAEAAALAAIPDGAPALLVLDRAESRGPALADLLGAAATGRNGALRILLVARDAGTWFDRLTVSASTVSANRVGDLLEPARRCADLTTRVLPGQVDARLVAAFVEPYAAVLGVVPPQVAVASVPGRAATMLELHAAALCAVLRAQSRRPHAPHGVLPVDVSDALDELLEHERWSWFRSAELAGVLGGEAGFLPGALDPLVAAATLTGVRTPDAARRLVHRVAAVVDGVRAGTAARVGSWLVELDPHRALPERLVDPHLLAELTAHPELIRASLTDAGLPSLRRAGLRAVELVTERLDGAPDDTPDGRPDDAGPALDRLGTVVAALPADHETLRAVLGAFPAPSLALGALRVEVAGRALAAAPSGDQVLRAAGQDELATALAEVGGETEGGGGAGDPAAVVDLWAAVGRARELVRDNPSPRHTERLTRSLAAVARRLVRDGRSVAAVEPAAESVRLGRRLAARRPDGYLPVLGDAHRVMDEVLADQGRPEDALQHAVAAVDVHRRTAREQPGRYLPDLAGSLQALGARRGALGDREAALDLVQEAVGVLRRLVADDPVRHTPDLAAGLCALGEALARSDRSLAALDAVREAIRSLRQLVRTEPTRHGRLLARALTGLSAVFAGLRLGDQAVAPAQEAVGILRGLTADDPAHRADLVAGLRALALALHDQEQFEAAREARAEVEDLL